MSLTANRGPAGDARPKREARDQDSGGSQTSEGGLTWPQAMVTCMRQHLSVGICDGILESCASQGRFVPEDWKTSSRRKALVAYICKRAAFFMPDLQVQKLQDALELASYSTWRRSDSAKLHRASTPRGSTARGSKAVGSSTASERAPAIARPARAPTSTFPPVDPGPPRRAASSGSHRALDPKELGGQQSRVSISVIREADVLSARTRALSVAGQAGASLFVRTRIATLVSELARRIHQAGAQGHLDLRVEHGHLVVESHDDGPTIGNLQDVLTFPSRHKEGPHAALAACKALAKDFTGTSRPGQGTILIARLDLH